MNASQHRLGDVDPLGGDAELAGVGEAGPDRTLGGVSTSASSSTSSGFLPPSSSEQPISRSAHWAATFRPVAVDPVKQT